MVFDRISKSVFEQQIIDCPFCSNSYVSKDEYRPLIQCQGNAQLAREAEDEMEYIRQNLDRRDCSNDSQVGTGPVSIRFSHSMVETST